MRWNVRACGWVRRGEELEDGRAMLDEYYSGTGASAGLERKWTV